MAPLGDIKLRVLNHSQMETSGPIIHSSTTLTITTTHWKNHRFPNNTFFHFTPGPIMASDPIIQSFNFAPLCVLDISAHTCTLCAAVPLFPNDLKLSSWYDSYAPESTQNSLCKGTIIHFLQL